jgi:hypothetical protein
LFRYISIRNKDEVVVLEIIFNDPYINKKEEKEKEENDLITNIGISNS